MKPSLYTCLSPALLQLYDLSDAIVVIIDVLRATSTIATALHNGASSIIPVDSVSECIQMGQNHDWVTAGERDGHIAEGLQYGNTPFQYTKEFIAGKTLVLTTTNGTRLLHMALAKNAAHIITGSFPNLTEVCEYLLKSNKNVVLACAAWKDRINIEDSLFAGAVINKVSNGFNINCDSSQIAESLYIEGENDLFGFMKQKQASHYHRLMNYGLEKDIRFCLSADLSPALPLYQQGKLINVKH